MRKIRITPVPWLCVCSLLVALSLVAPRVPAAEDQTLKVVLLPYPGYSEYDEQGQVIGRAADVLRQLLVRAGYDYQIQLLPIARVYRGLVSGELDVWLGLNNQLGLEAYTVQSRAILGVAPIYLYYLPGQPEPSWPSSMRGRSLILITNYNYSLPVSRVLQDSRLGIQTHSSSSHTGAIRMMMRGRGDYLLDYRGQAVSAMAELGIEPLPHIVVDEPPMRLFVSRQRADAAVLMDALDQAFEALVSEGVDMNASRQL